MSNLKNESSNIGRFIDPLSDFGFKHIFGNDQNKDLLLHFLNLLFKGQKEIGGIALSAIEHAGDNDKSKRVFFDLMCTSDSGDQFIIEMQRAEHRNFRFRSVFYTSRLITGQLPRGARNWNNVAPKNVYLIAILEFGFKDSEPGTYLQDVGIVNKSSGKTFYDNPAYKFLELPNFVKTPAELKTELDYWLYLLKHMSSLDKIPEVFNQPIFQKIFEIAEVSNLTKEEKDMYDSSLKARLDYESTIDYAREVGIEKGIEKGIEIGFAKARHEIEATRHKEVLETAQAMKQDGIPLHRIARYTRLSIDEIEHL